MMKAPRSPTVGLAASCACTPAHLPGVDGGHQLGLARGNVGVDVGFRFETGLACELGRTGHASGFGHRCLRIRFARLFAVGMDGLIPSATR